MHHAVYLSASYITLGTSINSKQRYRSSVAFSLQGTQMFIDNPSDPSALTSFDRYTHQIAYVSVSGDMAVL